MEATVNVIDGILNTIWDRRPKEIEPVIREIQQTMQPGSRAFARVAGASGAIAVMMSAYGAHAFNENTEDKSLKNVFDVSNRMHLVHSVALLGVPLCRKPALVGGLMTAGICLFSGTCYYHALTGDTRLRRATPYGGMLLIIAWLCMLL